MRSLATSRARRRARLGPDRAGRGLAPRRTAATSRRSTTTRVPLPAGRRARSCAATTRALRELRAAYAALDLPVLARSRWNSDAVERVPRPALVPRRDADHLALPRAAADQRAEVLRVRALHRGPRPAGAAASGSTRTARSAAGPSTTRATGASAATCSSRSTRSASSSALGLSERERFRCSTSAPATAGSRTGWPRRTAETWPTTAASTRSPSRRSSASTTCATAA